MEGSLTLDVNQLVRDGMIAPGLSRSSSLAWRSTRAGLPPRIVAEASYSVDVGEVDGTLTVEALERHDWRGGPPVLRHVIQLQATPQPFGGVRWWFVCPVSGALVVKLHLPLGAMRFASRKAHRLGYASQRQCPRDRHYARAYQARWRLGGDANLSRPIPPKPKGMRWRTYDRLHAQAEETTAATMAGLVAALERIQGRRRERAA